MVKNKKSVQEEKAQKKVNHTGKKTVDNPNEQVDPVNDNIDDESENETLEKNIEEDSEISTKENSPEIILEELIREKEEKYLRLVAEFDNYRKRTLREKAELTKLAGEYIITGLLPVVDDFDRAIESMNNTGDTESIKKGIELIYSKLREFLKQKNVSEIKAMGKEFDTDLHEAVTKIPAGSKKDKGKVMDVIEKGYLLHDKVIRYAKVVIGE